MPLIDRGFVAAVNHVLARTQWARERLLAHAGSQFRIDARPALIEAGIADDGLLSVPTAGRVPDVTLSLPLAQAPSMLDGGLDSLMSHVRIEGDAELAEALGFVFRNLEWDAEEDLSRIVGDAPAHRIAAALRALHASQRRAFEGVTGNLADYLSHEAGALVPLAEQAAFAKEVAQMRDAIARLDKRISRLQTNRPTRR